MEKTQFIEHSIAEDIKSILKRQVESLAAKEQLETADMSTLEKCARVYSIMQSSFREDLKANIFGNMSDEELDDIADDAGLEEEFVNGIDGTEHAD